MAQDYPSQDHQSQQTPDILSLVRDLEEKQTLLRDRVILLGKTVVEERDKTFNELQQLKSSVQKLSSEVKRIQELLERMAEQISNVARKEELAIIQRQLDILRKV